MSAEEVGSLSVTYPWQRELWQRIEEMVNSHRLPHALLLSGCPGIGKARFAKAVAHYLLCRQRDAGTPCGQCRPCLLNKAETHPDLKWLAPEEKGRRIKVDQVREVVGFVDQTSQQGGYKVAVVCPAEAMNINAANALLKSLEEPSGDSLLILVTDAPSRLLATIRSRCQVLNFPLPSTDEASTWLSAMVQEPGQVSQLLHEAGGQPLTALSLFESGALARYQTLETDFVAMVRGRQSALAIAQKWMDFDLQEVLLWLEQRLSAMLRFSTAGQPLSEAWLQLTALTDAKALFNLADQVIKLINKLHSGANPNRQLALEALLLDSCEVFQSKSP